MSDAPLTPFGEALARFRAWKFYREHNQVIVETDELKDGMLLFDAYEALRAELAEEKEGRAAVVADFEHQLDEAEARLSQAEALLREARPRLGCLGRAGYPDDRIAADIDAFLAAGNEGEKHG